MTATCAHPEAWSVTCARQGWAGPRHGSLRLRASIENLFDRAWNEAQFATTSQLAGEPAPVTELHFTPGSPRTLRVEAGWRV